MEFLNENWVYILIGIVALSKVLNTITKHFSEYKGLAKVCVFIIDLLDALKSTPAPKFVKDDSGKTILNK